MYDALFGNGIALQCDLAMSPAQDDSATAAAATAQPQPAQRNVVDFGAAPSGYVAGAGRGMSGQYGNKVADEDRGQKEESSDSEALGQIWRPQVRYAQATLDSLSKVGFMSLLSLLSSFADATDPRPTVVYTASQGRASGPPPRGLPVLHLSQARQDSCGREGRAGGVQGSGWLC